MRAAGFRLAAHTKGGSWDTPSRRRVDKHPTGRKFRWEIGGPVPDEPPAKAGGDEGEGRQESFW